MKQDNAAVDREGTQPVKAPAQQADAASRIVAAELFELDIPFDDGSVGYDAPSGRWSSFETVLVRITTADGISGWGECFAYGCRSAVAESFRTMVAPLLIGQDADDISGLMRRIQHKLHLFGRYGITIFAISGADIALWDRRAKAAGRSLASLLGKRRTEVPAYASLVHYGYPPLVRDRAKEAVQEGYASVKLHETRPENVRAGRDGAGPGTHLTVDANCAWTLDEAKALLPALEGAGIDWLEEPLFPPEDFEAMAALAAATSIPLSAGENACTRYEFHRMMTSDGVTFPQPSVTKIGGVTEFAAVLQEADRRAVACMPHSPYFGPGYWATLQLLAVVPGAPFLEYLYVQPAAFPGLDTPKPTRGRITIPDTPGIGFEPDWNALITYRAR